MLLAESQADLVSLSLQKCCKASSSVCKLVAEADMVHRSAAFNTIGTNVPVPNLAGHLCLSSAA